MIIGAPQSGRSGGLAQILDYANLLSGSRFELGDDRFGPGVEAVGGDLLVLACEVGDTAVCW